MTGHTAQHGRDFLFQLTNARLARVVFNHFEKNLFAKFDFILLETVFAQFLGNKVALGNFQFLFRNVTAYLDNLHAVEQWTADGRKAVGRSDEQNLGQVIIHVKIIVVEVAVLLGVKHLEQGRRRVALEILSHLVDLVKHDDGIVAATLG